MIDAYTHTAVCIWLQTSITKRTSSKAKPIYGIHNTDELHQGQRHINQFALSTVALFETAKQKEMINEEKTKHMNIKYTHMKATATNCEFNGATYICVIENRRHTN